ncbi:LysM domain-containing protein, partial [Pseudomonas sp. GD04042]
VDRWNGSRWKPYQYTFFNENRLIGTDRVERDIMPGYNAIGLMVRYRYTVYDKNGDPAMWGENYTNYIAFDTWKEHRIQANVNRGTPGITTMEYGLRGDLLTAVSTGNTPFTRRYASDRNGQLIMRTDGNNASAQTYVMHNGNVLASIGNNSTPEIFDTISSVSPSEIERTPTNYVIVDGDTLQGIAQKIWGDSGMWYLIADANGLSANSELIRGTTLTIPNVAGSNSNNAGTFKAYNPSEVTGDLTPVAKYQPPKPKKKKSGGLGSIVMVVVAVVAAVFTAGAALAAMGAAGSFMSIGATAMTAGGIGAATLGGSGLAAGVVAFGAAAAAGSAASQLTGMAMGVQDKFSWSQVAVAGITGGITAGVSSFISNPAATAAAGYVGNYAASKVVGLDTSFSWAGMAASVVGSTIGSYVGGNAAKAGTFGTFAKAVARDQFTALTTAAITDKWFGGARPNYAQVATDAFGNTLGNSIKGQMVRADQEARLDQWTKGELDRAGARVEDARLRVEQEQQLADWTGGELLRAEARTSDRVTAYADAKNVRAAATKASQPYDSAWMNTALGAGLTWNALLDASSLGVYETTKERYARLISASDVPVINDPATNSPWDLPEEVRPELSLSQRASNFVSEHSLVSFQPLNGNFAHDVAANIRNAAALPANVIGIGAGAADSLLSLNDGTGYKLLDASMGLPGAGFGAWTFKEIGLAAKSLGAIRAEANAARIQFGTVRESDSTILNLLYGARVKEGLPGLVGAPITRRPSVAELENLTLKHDVEFAVTYKLGEKSGGRGGQYFLHSGSKSQVHIPLEADRMLIYHTHPSSTALASVGDRLVMETLELLGSPQRSSQIIPVGKEVVRFNKSTTINWWNKR